MVSSICFHHFGENDIRKFLKKKNDIDNLNKI